MSNNQHPLIFDGHNDLLSHLVAFKGKDLTQFFLDGYERGHLDLPRMLKGGFGGGLFVLWVPSPIHRGNDATSDKPQDMLDEEYDMPLEAEVSIDIALPKVMQQLALLARIERKSAGKFKICTTANEVKNCLKLGVIAAVIHMEGAEAIDNDLHNLEVLYRAGLRSIGPVWSRPTRFGCGVPFKFPSSPDTGPGLTDIGKELVRACNQLGIIVDVSHITEKGFWDIAKISHAPLVATHSNVHAISQQARNLTDKQLAAIKESEGIVGVNFVTAFLRPDGQMLADTPLETILRHIDYLIEHVGIDCIGFGSDFDGALIPEKIGDVTGLMSLREAMRKHGYDEATILKLCQKNWLRILEKSF